MSERELLDSQKYRQVLRSSCNQYISLKSRNDKTDVKQIRSAGSGPAWNAEVDQWTTANKDSERTKMDKN